MIIDDYTTQDPYIPHPVYLFVDSQQLVWVLHLPSAFYDLTYSQIQSMFPQLAEQCVQVNKTTIFQTKFSYVAVRLYATTVFVGQQLISDMCPGICNASIKTPGQSLSTLFHLHQCVTTYSPVGDLTKGHVMELNMVVLNNVLISRPLLISTHVLCFRLVRVYMNPV